MGRIGSQFGQCVSVQGELVRANERLQSEYFRNGLGNYYERTSDSTGDDTEKLHETFCKGKGWLPPRDATPSSRRCARAK